MKIRSPSLTFVLYGHNKQYNIPARKGLWQMFRDNNTRDYLLLHEHSRFPFKSASRSFLTLEKTTDILIRPNDKEWEESESDDYKQFLRIKSPGQVSYNVYGSFFNSNITHKNDFLNEYLFLSENNRDNYVTNKIKPNVSAYEKYQKMRLE